MPQPALPPFARRPDYAAFLRQQLAQQSAGIASYQLGGEQVWLKKAAPRRGRWRQRLLGALAWALRLPVLRPLPPLGGSAAIATEARRLRDLAARGLRVPAVLAVQPGGLLLRHLGRSGQPTPTLARALQEAVPAGAQAVLGLWHQGLQALSYVHTTGTSLGQACARTPGSLPRRHPGLPPLCGRPGPYPGAGARPGARRGAQAGAHALWQQWLAECSPGVRAALAHSGARLAWLRHLPSSGHLGPGLQRARALHDVLAAPRAERCAAPAAAGPPSRTGRGPVCKRA